MKLLNQHNIDGLSKVLYKTDIMPSGNSRSFTQLSEKLILGLQNEYSPDKIRRIISNELIVTYGISINEKEVAEISEAVDFWYNE